MFNYNFWRKSASQAFLCTLAAALAQGCGANNGDSLAADTLGSTTSTSLASTSTTLAITPDIETIAPGATAQFSASGGTPPYYFAIANGGAGTINQSTGLFTAPVTVGTVTVTAEDSAYDFVSATVYISSGGASGVGGTVTLTPATQNIQPGASLQYTATGGTPPYSYYVISGPGTIIQTTGLYLAAGSGTGTAQIAVSDANNEIAYASLTIGGSNISGTAYALGNATSNDVLSGWPASNATDGSTITDYSSNIFTSASNNRGTYLAAWFLGSPQQVSQVILTPRTEASGAIDAFPQSYMIYLTSPTNSLWELIGTYTNQPAGGTATITLPSTYLTYGVMIEPVILGADTSGNYYFQLAEIDLAN